MPREVTQLGGLYFDDDGKVLSGRYGVSMKTLGLLAGVRTFALTWNAETGRLLSKLQDLPGLQVMMPAGNESRSLGVKGRGRDAPQFEIRDQKTGERIGGPLQSIPLAMHAGARRQVAYQPADRAGVSPENVGDGLAPMLVLELIDETNSQVIAALPGMAAEVSRKGDKLVITTLTGAWVVVDSNTGRTLMQAPPGVPYSSRWGSDASRNAPRWNSAGRPANCSGRAFSKRDATAPPSSSHGREGVPAARHDAAGHRCTATPGAARTMIG